MRYSQNKPFQIHDQDGAALFMALIFLLILTVLGVFGMNLSRLENMMAGNSQFQTTALNNAEYVLARGETDIQDLAKDGTTNPFLLSNDSDQYFDAAAIDASALNWTFWSKQVTLPDLDNDGTPDGTGAYVIEDAGLDNTKGECASYECKVNPLPGAVVQVFLVTARSSTSRGASRIVQSVVVTDPLPPTP